MTVPGTIRPEPLSAEAAARPRDSSGRVTLPIRAEVKFNSGRGYRRYFTTWPEVAGWLASPSFTGTASAVKTLTIVAQDPDLGPDLDGRERREESAARGFHRGNP